MSEQAPPNPEEIRHLDGEWRQRRRRIDVLAGDSALYDDFLTSFKATYHHLKRDSPVEMSQFFPALHAMADAYQLVRPALDQLTQLHLDRDHSAAETRCCYPAEARALARDCRALLGLMRDSRASLAPHVETEFRRKLEDRFDRFEQRARDLVAALEEGAGFAEQLQAMLSGSAGEHDRVGGGRGGGEGIRRDLKPGYKQTEVGVIPEDWDLKQLNRLTNQIVDGTHHTPRYTDSGVPFLRVTDIQTSDISLLDLKYVSHAEHQVLKMRCSPEKGDLLLSKNGTIGIPKIVTWDWEFSIFVSLALLKLRKESISAGFLEQFIKSDYLKEQIHQRSKQGTVTNLHLEEIREFLIPLPPTLAEQEAIAAALSDADALIDSLEQLIAKKRLLKQGAMQDLLTGKKRLPGFEGEWEETTLGEIAHIKTGSRNNQDKVEDGEYPFFVRSATVERINSFSHDCEAILVPGEGGIGSIFHYINGRFDVHQRVYAITQFSDSVSGKYVYLYMAEHFGAHAMENSVKATVDSLRLPTFQGFSIALPPTLVEQTAIAAILSDMDAEIAAVEAKLAKARQVKQGMMQELLTGKTRLVRKGDESHV